MQQLGLLVAREEGRDSSSPIVEEATRMCSLAFLGALPSLHHINLEARNARGLLDLEQLVVGLLEELDLLGQELVLLEHGLGELGLEATLVF